MIHTIAALIFLGAFYISYIAKMVILRRQNIQADILGKGEKPKSASVLEILLKCTAYLGSAVQFVSVIFESYIWIFPVFPAVRAGGLILMLLGTGAFIAAIAAMKSSWRAGYSDGQNTELVTAGIYRFSRNPAFLGFDLLYTGCALAFPNPVSIIMAFAAIILFHLQILGEERFLIGAFGRSYADYKAKTGRYLWMKKN